MVLLDTQTNDYSSYLNLTLKYFFFLSLALILRTLHTVLLKKNIELLTNKTYQEKLGHYSSSQCAGFSFSKKVEVDEKKVGGDNWGA